MLIVLWVGKKNQKSHRNPQPGLILSTFPLDFTCVPTFRVGSSPSDSVYFLETYRSLFLSKLLAIWSLPFTKLSSPAFWTTRSRWTQPTGGIYLSCSSNTRIWQQNWDFSCSICSHLGSFKHRLWERPRKGRGELKYLEGKSHLFDKLWTACQAGLIYWRNRR